MNKSINFKNTVPALLIGLAFVGLSFVVAEEFTFSQNTDLTSLTGVYTTNPILI